MFGHYNYVALEFIKTGLGIAIQIHQNAQGPINQEEDINYQHYVIYNDA